MTFPYELAQPGWLWFLLLLPAMVAWRIWRIRTETGLRFSNSVSASLMRPTLRLRLRQVPLFLRTTALCLGIIALARPQERNVSRERFAEGVDIMMVLDTSTSMRAEDFTPNRFEAARQVGAEFVRECVQRVFHHTVVVVPARVLRDAAAAGRGRIGRRVRVHVRHNEDALRAAQHLRGIGAERDVFFEPRHPGVFVRAEPCGQFIRELAFCCAGDAREREPERAGTRDDRGGVGLGCW